MFVPPEPRVLSSTQMFNRYSLKERTLGCSVRRKEWGSRYCWCISSLLAIFYFKTVCMYLF